MKVPSSTTLHPAAVALAFLGSGNSGITTAMASTCDTSIFGPPVVINSAITSVATTFKFNTIDPRPDIFEMPRATWTIEPAPEGVNTTSVFMSPADLGTVGTIVAGGGMYGITIDTAAVVNATAVSILIQAPRDALERVDIQSPFFVNIAAGFTRLNSLYVEDGSVCYDTDAGCPLCNDLYTAEEVSGIGPSVVADLSSVDVRRTYSTSQSYDVPISITQFSGGGGIYDLTIVLPSDDEVAIGLDLNLEPTQANIKIKGDVACKNHKSDNTTDELNEMLTIEYFCGIRGRSEPGCKESSTNLVVEGSIADDFRVSATGAGYEVIADVLEEAGCDHFVPNFGAEEIGPFTCQDGGNAIAIVGATPFPCAGSTEIMECQPNPFDGDYTFNLLCRVPLPERQCSPQTSSGLLTSARSSVLSLFSTFVAGVVWIW